MTGWSPRQVLVGFTLDTEDLTLLVRVGNVRHLPGRGLKNLSGASGTEKLYKGVAFASRGATSFVFSGTDCALLDAKYDVTGSGRGIPRGWHRRGYGISYKLCRMRAGGDGACEGGKSPTGGGPRLSILLVRQPVTGNGELFRPIIQGHRGGG